MAPRSCSRRSICAIAAVKSLFGPAQRAEKTPFSQDEFLALMALARKGVARLVDLQKMAVA